jgi:hypothetical protein
MMNSQCVGKKKNPEEIFFSRFGDSGLSVIHYMVNSYGKHLVFWNKRKLPRELEFSGESVEWMNRIFWM